MSMQSFQVEICRQYGSDFCITLPWETVGAAKNLESLVPPLNGLRIQSTQGVSGWFLWRGEEFEKSPDFFEPLHAKHLTEICPDAEKFLGLAPGWRFLLAPDYEDVWFDPEILGQDDHE